MLKAAMNGSRISRSKAIYMAPSLIHHIHPHDDCFGLTGSASPNDDDDDFLSGTGISCCPELDRTVAELTAVGLSQVRHLKVQIVEKEGHWFALNSAQLELCRRLERDGLCAKVKVDVVPSHEVPLNVRNLMTLPVYGGAVTKKSKEKEKEDEGEGQLTNEERSVSPANRACGIVVRGRKGYQQLDQDEEDDEDGEKDRTEDKTRRSDASNNESNRDEDEDDDTEDGSSPGASGDSDIDWSEEEEEEEDCNLSSSSAGEWSDVEGGDHSNRSDVVDEIMTSGEEDDEDEGNCLL